MLCWNFYFSALCVCRRFFGTLLTPQFQRAVQFALDLLSVMLQTFDAIYEGGVFRPLNELQLPDKQRVRITVEATAERPSPLSESSADPLAELAADLGVTDLAENFDDYRFGRRQP